MGFVMTTASGLLLGYSVNAIRNSREFAGSLLQLRPMDAMRAAESSFGHGPESGAGASGITTGSPRSIKAALYRSNWGDDSGSDMQLVAESHDGEAATASFPCVDIVDSITAPLLSGEQSGVVDLLVTHSLRWASTARCCDSRTVPGFLSTGRDFASRRTMLESLGYSCRHVVINGLRHSCRRANPAYFLLAAVRRVSFTQIPSKPGFMLDVG